MITVSRGGGGHLQVCNKVLLLMSLLICVPAPATAQEVKNEEVNVVKSIRAKGSTIEIELHSSREFTVRDEVVVLRVGKKEVLRSRHDANGSLNTLIFILKADEFEQLADDEPMTVAYGRQNADAGISARSRRPDAGPRWNFGTLNKALLSR